MKRTGWGGHDESGCHFRDDWLWREAATMSGPEFPKKVALVQGFESK